MIYGTIIRCNNKKVAVQNCELNDWLRTHTNENKRLIGIKKEYGNFTVCKISDGIKSVTVQETQRIMVYNELRHTISVKRVGELDKFDRFYMFGKEISRNEIVVKKESYSGMLFAFNVAEDKTFIANDIILR